jgi:hypothetical protein
MAAVLGDSQRDLWTAKCEGRGTVDGLHGEIHACFPTGCRESIDQSLTLLFSSAEKLYSAHFVSPFLDPAILFFGVGLFAGLVRSNLEMPQQVSRFLALYLLMALGLKGGFALAKSGLTEEVASGLAAAILLAVVTPLLGYAVLRRFTGGFDAAALAATYGSVSAVTFITATQYLGNHSIAFGGHMAAAMALMESPAILIAVAMANRLRRDVPGAAPPAGFGSLLRESFTEGAQLLLLGAMVVGLLSGDAGEAAMKPFAGDLFKGLLAFFLLDMGLQAARNLPEVRGKSPAMLAYAVLAPLAHAGLALGLATALGLSAGDGALLMVLAASASYIAVPAVLRHAMPEANPSVYFGLSLGVTFPLNLLLGIPLYAYVAGRFLG